MTYVDMVHNGAAMIKEHYIWILPGLVLFAAAYLLIHHQVMKSNRTAAEK
jgi:Na+/H+ antiporter NhaC